MKPKHIQLLHCCEMCEDVIGDDRNIIIAEIQNYNAPVVDCEGSRRNVLYGIMRQRSSNTKYKGKINKFMRSININPNYFPVLQIGMPKLFRFSAI